MTEEDEKRRLQRHSANQIFAGITTLGFRGDDHGFGIIEDVSEKGLRLKCHQSIDINTKLVLKINVDEQLFEVHAVVRRSKRRPDKAWEFGLEIDTEKEGTNGFVAAFLARSPDSGSG